MVIADLRVGFGCELNLRPETTMTDERMAPIEVIEKGAEGRPIWQTQVFIEARIGQRPEGARRPSFAFDCR